MGAAEEYAAAVDGPGGSPGRPRRRGPREYLIRYAVFGLGLLCVAFGVAFSIRAALGTTTISAPPYVVSLIAPITVGWATIILHVLMITAQIVILGRRYQPIQLLQLPVGIVFGRVKIVNDVAHVLAAVVISLVGLGTVVGVREGTVSAALLVGLIAGPVIRLLKPRLDARVA